MSISRTGFIQRPPGTHTSTLGLASLCLVAGSAFGQTHEIGLTLGRILTSTRTSAANPLEIDGGVALQANYGRRLLDRGRFSLTGEVHFLANSQRQISSLNLAATRDVATLYVTPGLRFKVRAPKIAPYGVVGGGYALYEQSLFQINDSPNPAPRFIHRGAFMFGAGVDVPVWRWLGARFEVRDFYTGNPAFNAAVMGGQHNVVAGGGFVLSFGGGRP